MTSLLEIYITYTTYNLRDTYVEPTCIELRDIDTSYLNKILSKLEFYQHIILKSPEIIDSNNLFIKYKICYSSDPEMIKCRKIGFKEHIVSSDSEPPQIILGMVKHVEYYQCLEILKPMYLKYQEEIHRIMDAIRQGSYVNSPSVDGVFNDLINKLYVEKITEECSDLELYDPNIIGIIKKYLSY